MTLSIDFLAHTRSTYFDYAWILGLEDQSFENDLGKFIIAWLGNTQLDSLPPVAVFFTFKGRCILLWGRRSEERRDQSNRRIFERALYVWDAREEFPYSRLAPLLEDLEVEAADLFESVPLDAVRAPRTVKRLELDSGKLDQAARKYRESIGKWSLPFDLTPQELVKGGLTVEVPSDWSFAKMLMPLGDAAIDPSEPVCIGSSLTYKHRGELAGGGWLVSGTASDNGDLGDLPRARDANGNLMDLAAVERMRARWAEEAARTSKKSQQRPEPADRNTIPPPPQPQAEPESFPADFQEAVYLSQQLAPQEQGFFRRSANDGIAVCVRRLQFLISPAGRLMGQDVLVAWQWLLQEILLCHEIASPGIAEEWMRRLGTLRRLLSHPGRSYPRDWSPEFQSACNHLQQLLDKVRYRNS